MKIATANIRRDLSDADAASALAKVLHKGPAFVALQEWGYDRAKLLRRVDPGATWAYAGGRRPILFTPHRFQLVDTHMATLSPGRRVSRLPGRKAVLPASVARIATFLDRETAAYLTVLNFHLPAAVETHGRPRLSSGPARLDQHAEATNTLVELFYAYTRLDHHVFAAGDSNVDHRADVRAGHKAFPASRFATVGGVSCWDGNLPDDRDGSHGHRLIDAVWSTRNADRVTQVRHRGDHDAVLASYL